MDFDRKWAESTTDARQGDGDDNNKNNDPSSDDDDYGDSEVEGGPDDDKNKMVEYEDEFGRLRHGTARDMEREHRRQRAVQHATSTLADNSARPTIRPDNLIYGATVQAAAFNPNATLTAQMAGLASKRDRSATPPEEVHYDARTEVRAKGVGFFQFSRDQREGERDE